MNEAGCGHWKFPVIALIAGLLFNCRGIAAGEEQDPENRPYMGISTSPVDEPAPGLTVRQVLRDSPAFLADLEEGDVLIALDGDSLRDSAALLEALEERRAGDLVRLLVYRKGALLKLPLVLGRRRDYLGPMRRGNRPHFPGAPDQIRPPWKDDRAAGLVLEAVQAAGLDTQYAALREAYARELQEYRGYYTLDAVAYSLLLPHQAGMQGEEIMRRTGSLGAASAAGRLAGAAAVLDAPLPGFHAPPPTESGLPGLAEALALADVGVRRAFADLGDERLEALARESLPLLESLVRYLFIHTDPESERVDAFYECIDHSKRIRWSELFQAAAGLARLASPGVIEELGARLHRWAAGRSPDENDVLLDTLLALDSGVVVRARVTGYGSSVIQGQAALSVDLGGDDVYLDGAGGTCYEMERGAVRHFPQGRAALAIDFGGDDRYLCNRPGGIAGGLLGLGFLLDAEGDDLYLADALGCGAALFGCGVLLDSAGDDLYMGQELAQGCALFGIGLLADEAGNDVYSAARFAQGFGGPKGCGLLIDGAGDDSYSAGFKEPNGYGNRDSWEGWSQGVGFGMRSVAAGGVGLLSDLVGDDRYLAGNFSQACGYFFGFGLLNEGGGDDLYTGNRYTMGAQAHQACALFHERGGNDVYRGAEAMNQGGSWDVGPVFFLEDAGDDDYEGAQYAQGGTAQNGFAVFIDSGGADTYRSGGISNGAGGANEYAGGRDAASLSVSLDLGGGADAYDNERRGNGMLLRTDDDDDPATGDGVFVDE